MDIKLQEYYENRLTMMASKGWVDLMEDVETMLVSTNSLSGVEDIQKLYFKKGELSILRWLSTLRDVSSKSYEQLKDE